MKIVNIHEAKTHLSALLKLIQDGQEVIIAKKGKPIARLTEYNQKKTPRKGGQLNGKIKVSDSFDEWPEDIAKSLGIVD